MNAFVYDTDDHLFHQLKQSNEQAFAVLYERYWEELFDSAERILGDTSAAQDCVQEVFIYLWKRRSELEIISFRSYIFQAVRFQVFKAIRAKKTSADFFKRLLSVSSELLEDDLIIFKDLQSILETVIASLPQDQREIFKMNREQGMTYNEIAQQRNISVKTVEKKMSQALKHIRTNSGDVLLALITCLLVK